MGGDSTTVTEKKRPRAPRHQVRLPFSISLLGNDGDSQPHLRLVGHTRNVSLTGMALIVPSVQLGYRKLVDRGAVLRIRFALSTGVTEVEATPTRFVRLGDADGDVGYLIGVRILHMMDKERRLFIRRMRTE